MLERIWLPQIDEELWTGFGDCILARPTGALNLVNDLACLAASVTCNTLGECEIIYPVEASALPCQIVLGTIL